VSSPSRIIVAFDFPEARPALDLAQRLDPARCKVKIGSELFASGGPNLVESLVSRGFDVFLDLKFHDIPNTVASACAAAARLGVWMLNVHASGGKAMLQAARDAIPGTTGAPKLTAVTVLTSMSAGDLADLGIAASLDELVLRLALMAKACGLDGVVCSAREAADLRAACGPEFDLVTPGIRPAGAEDDDQQRVMTPAAALNNGASFLVIGRPITRASDPLAVLDQIEREIAGTIRAP
jgi:orotidine-5'-phosphate decarboxylase